MAFDLTQQPAVSATSKRRRRRLSPNLLAFLATVVLPTLLATGYYYGIATDRYVSEAKFMVRGVTGRHIGGLAALFRTFGIARAEDDAFAVHSYMMSLDATQALESQLGLKAMFSRPRIDVLSRYPRPWRSDSAESLFDFYQDRISLTYSPAQGISTLRVDAWAPDDAQQIAAALLQLSEALINRMNKRANTDSLANAESERDRAEKLVLTTQNEITLFRNRELLLDPSLASLKTLDLIGRLSVELAQTRTALAETTASSPASPALQGLQVRIRALQDQIASERGNIVGTDTALAEKISEYERLVLRREFAERNLAAASSAVENARQEARRQQIYIETIVAPARADEPTQPRRLRSIASVFVLGFALYSMLWLVISGAREHSHG